IAEIVDGYARAAVHARDGGLDGVEVSMAHGYLPAQFFSPGVNRRSDRYGGSEDARLRFGLEVLEAIRAAIGGQLAVGIRLSADEIDPDGAGRAACHALAARRAATGLADYVPPALRHSATYR